MKDRFLDTLHKYCDEGLIEKKYCSLLEGFYLSYISEVENIKKKNINLLLTFIELVKKQFEKPYTFELYHKKIREPFDFYLFGVDFLRPLIEKDSSVLGLENIKKMQDQIKRKENVILFANHQTESDPLAISVLLDKDFPAFASKIIYVAGERVITDPLAVPFSMGCDLLCIYSKNYINNPPELKRQKQFHNKKTMELMSKLLREGGKIIYVAPSGGRDRPNKQKVVEIAPFDPDSIEMFYLMAKRSKSLTHFYPLTLLTYHLLPPPDSIQIEMGEKRKTKKAKIHAFFEKEIDMENFPGKNEKDKILRRKNRAEYIHNIVKNSYEKLRSL